MKDDPSELVRLAESQIEAAAETLTQAFFSYPVFTYVFPDEAERSVQLPLVKRSIVQYGLANGEVYTTSAGVEGVAAWMPPDHGDGPWPQAAISQDALNRLAHFGKEIWEIRKRHVPFTHWFLMMIGVAPDFQGQGLASKLLSPLLARIDEEAMPCYLDTELPKNVEMYQHFGFRVVEDTIIPGTGIRSWGMLREASG